MNIPLIGTGLSGLVGSKFVDLYKDTYTFEDLSRETDIDITNKKVVIQKCKTSQAKHLIHFAAYTNVSKAHEEYGNKQGVVYKVNVTGTENIIEACQQTGKHLIHISTAYVFDGDKKGLYTEEDTTHPIEWYGQTKTWAEEKVMKSDIPWTILRIDQPYRLDSFGMKRDILHRIINDLKNNTLPPMFTDHTFTPTNIEIFSKYLHSIIQNNITGLFHATTDPATTDYEFALAIKKKYNLPGEVRKGLLETYRKKLKRPYQKNTALSTKKLFMQLSLSSRDTHHF